MQLLQNEFNVTYAVYLLWVNELDLLGVCDEDFYIPNYIEYTKEEARFSFFKGLKNLFSRPSVLRDNIEPTC